MSYTYQAERSKVFTEEGQRMFLRIRDKTKRLLGAAGAVRLGSLIEGVTGDSWTMLACVDRMVELGELRELETGGGWAQDRVFVRLESAP